MSEKKNTSFFRLSFQQEVTNQRSGCPREFTLTMCEGLRVSRQADAMSQLLLILSALVPRCVAVVGVLPLPFLNLFLRVLCVDSGLRTSLFIGWTLGAELVAIRLSEDEKSSSFTSVFLLLGGTLKKKTRHISGSN